MKRGKEVYDKIEIPAALSERVNKAIASVDRTKAKQKAKKLYRSRKLVSFVKITGNLAAAFILCLTLGVNTSQAFAVEVAELPVIGALSRVLTVRSYIENTDNVELYAEVPQIQADRAVTEETDTFFVDINAEIEKIVDDFVAGAQQDMADYKDAFFATGGTEKEWTDRTMDVQVTYEVTYQSGPYLSMILRADKCWIAAYEENHYYNLNLETHQDVTLEELLGADYIAICNESIMAEIEKQIAEDENKIYFGYGPYAEEMDDEMMFKTITSDESFYINESGNPVICFEKYEIAPGYMGVCEFEILQ